MNADANAASQPMQVNGLDDPKATEMVFRFPTPLVQEALRMIAAKYGAWVKLQIRKEGTFILEWIFGNDNPIAKQHGQIRWAKAALGEFTHPKEGVSLCKRFAESINQETKKDLENHLAKMKQRQADHFKLREEVAYIEKRLPKSALRDALVKRVSEGRVYGTDYIVEASVTLAKEALNRFTPMTWEEFREIKLRELNTLLVEAECLKKSLREERGQLKKALRRFLKQIVAMEMATQAQAKA